MNDLPGVVTYGALPASARRWSSTAPQVLAAGDQITGRGPFFVGLGPVGREQRRGRTRRLLLRPCTVDALPVDRRLRPSRPKRLARSVSSSSFSGDDAMSTVTHPSAAAAPRRCSRRRPCRRTGPPRQDRDRAPALEPSRARTVVRRGSAHPVTSRQVSSSASSDPASGRFGRPGSAGAVGTPLARGSPSTRHPARASAARPSSPVTMSPRSSAPRAPLIGHVHDVGSGHRRRVEQAHLVSAVGATRRRGAARPRPRSCPTTSYSAGAADEHPLERRVGLDSGRCARAAPNHSRNASSA